MLRKKKKSTPLLFLDLNCDELKLRMKFGCAFWVRMLQVKCGFNPSEKVMFEMC